MDVPEQPPLNSSPTPSRRSDAREKISDELSAGVHRGTMAPQAIEAQTQQSEQPAAPTGEQNRDCAAFDDGTTRRNLIREIHRSTAVPRCREVQEALAGHRRAFRRTILDK